MTAPGTGGPDPTGQTGDPDVAALASVLADPSRARILLALLDGRSLPASVLAHEAGVAASTTSGHLARLLDAGLVSCRPQGRHRYYALAGPEVATLVEQLSLMAPRRPVRSLRQGTRAAAMRRARTCYDHLAGALGVELFGHLVDAGHLIGGDGRHHPETAVHDRLSARGRDHSYRLTTSGRRALATVVDGLPESDDDGTVPVRYCLDWTEQRHHLSGVVGRALTATLFDRAWLERPSSGRAVRLTDEGRSRLVDAGLLPADPPL